jgi:hypothetical protein
MLCLRRHTHPRSIMILGIHIRDIFNSDCGPRDENQVQDLRFLETIGSPLAETFDATNPSISYKPCLRTSTAGITLAIEANSGERAR